MRAVRLIEPGLIEIQEIDEPSPGDGEVLVKVHAAAITRGELDWPLDRLPATPSYELSGQVQATGSGVDGLTPGDDVFALTPFDRNGAAAELIVVPETSLAPKPQALDHVEAASLPMPGLSAWQGLFDHGKLAPRERLRISGARGGVGHVAVQLATWAGAEVVDDDADLLFDTNGDLGTGAARVVTIAEEMPGATYFVVEPNGEQLAELGRLAEEGALRPEIDSVFPLEDAKAAFARLTQRGKRGKVVLRVAG